MVEDDGSESQKADGVAEGALDVDVLVAHEGDASDDLHELALLGRPVEQGPDDPLPLPRERAPRGVTLARILDVEGNGVADHGVRPWSRGAAIEGCIPRPRP